MVSWKPLKVKSYRAKKYMKSELASEKHVRCWIDRFGTPSTLSVSEICSFMFFWIYPWVMQFLDIRSSLLMAAIPKRPHFDLADYFKLNAVDEHITMYDWTISRNVKKIRLGSWTPVVGQETILTAQPMTFHGF